MAPRRRRRLTVLAVSGPSGSGKTRLLTRLIPALRRRGLVVGALKHAGHAHPIDRRGKDSHRLRRAGAAAVAVQGPAEMAFFGPRLPGGARALARLLPPVDLVLAEGFKREPLPRLEVHRRAVAREFLCGRDRRVVAVVGDEAPPRDLPWFRPSQVEALADFLVGRLRLAPRRFPTTRPAGVGGTDGAPAERTRHLRPRRSSPKRLDAVSEKTEKIPPS
ncbi:MAG TPA: molybdopterin-guanine dinucleotide biosynthesis protein B [Anaeromyxobacteraceae bacterium]|nr:molybdopterin-guanine dinucleotide biosynthesis protein B [Anaeromyxobacteraceae bacterium]